MPDVDATQETPLLRSHAPMLVNNARLWPCLFLWHFFSSSLPAPPLVQLALWHSSDRLTSLLEHLYLAPQLVAQESVQVQLLSPFQLVLRLLSLLELPGLLERLLSLSLCFWNVRLTFWFRVEPLLLLLHRRFDGSRFWFRTGLNGFLLLFNDIPSSDHVQFITDSLLSILLSLVAAIWFDEFFGVFFGQDFGCIFVASDMGNVAKPLCQPFCLLGRLEGLVLVVQPMPVRSDWHRELLQRLLQPLCQVSSLDRLVALVEESFVSSNVYRSERGLFLLLFLFLGIFLIVTFFCRDVKLLLICIVRLVGFLVLLRHVYCLCDIVHHCSGALTAVGSVAGAATGGSGALTVFCRAGGSRWSWSSLRRLLFFGCSDFAVRAGDSVEDCGCALLVCGCVTGGGVGTRSGTTATWGEFGESEGDGVSKTPIEFHRPAIPVAFRCAACLVLLLMLMTMMKQQLLQDWDWRRWSSDAAPCSSSWCWQAQIEYPSVVLLTALSEGSRLPALVALLPFEPLEGYELELDWEAATATIKPANCVVNARAQVDVAPQPALHPPRDLSPALPASLGLVLTIELDLVSTAYQSHTCFEQARHWLQPTI
ncbi:hypothetical protein KCU96_g11, partial [Aureobasidium melanogenum]